MPRSGAIPRTSPLPSTPPTPPAPRHDSLPQRISRAVFRFFECLANFFCCCFRESARSPSIHRISGSPPSRVPSPSFYPPPHSYSSESSSSSSSSPGFPPPPSGPLPPIPSLKSSTFSLSMPDFLSTPPPLLLPSDLPDEAASLSPIKGVEPPSPIEGVWLSPGELTVAENAHDNPIGNVLMYREEIEKLLKERETLEVATKSHRYTLSIPAKGTLQIQRHKDPSNSSWIATLSERVDQDIPNQEVPDQAIYITTPLCTIAIDGKPPSENESEILSELQQIATAIEAANAHYDQIVAIQRSLLELDPKLPRLLSNFVHEKCYKKQYVYDFKRYVNVEVEGRYEAYNTRFKDGTTSRDILVELSGDSAKSSLKIPPRRTITFRTEEPAQDTTKGSVQVTLSLSFDDEGNLGDVSLSSPSSKFFTTNAKGSISTPQLQRLLTQLLTQEAMSIGNAVFLHPIVIKLNPFAVLSQLSTTDDSFHISGVYFLTDEFRNPGTSDAGGPTRQFIGDLSYHFLGGSPRANIPLTMAYRGMPKIRLGSSATDVDSACRHLARLITYCHNSGGKTVMGRVLKDLFFEMIRYIDLLQLKNKDLSNQKTLLDLIYAMFPDFIAKLLPKEGFSFNFRTEEEENISVDVDLQTIIETVAHYGSPAHAAARPGEDAEQCRRVICGLTGKTDLMHSKDLALKKILDETLIDQFGSIIRVVQQVTRYLPQQVLGRLNPPYKLPNPENTITNYSQFVQGAPLNPAAIAQRIQPDSNAPWLIEKCGWIREFVRDSKYYDAWIASLPEEQREEEKMISHEQWVESLVRFAIGSPTLPNGRNIKICPAKRGSLCEGHTCFGELGVPEDHPRIGVPKGTVVDDKKALFLNLHYSIRNGGTFTVN